MHIKYFEKLRNKSAWWLAALWVLSFMWIIWPQHQRITTLRYDENDFLSLIQQAVQAQLSQAHVLLAQTAQTITEQPNLIFKADLPDFHYVYVFQDKRVWYWNNYEIDPEIIRPTEPTEQLYQENAQGKFIFLQKAVTSVDGRNFQILVAIPLYRNYQLNNRFLVDKWLIEALNITNPLIKTLPGRYNVYGANNKFLFSVSPDNFNSYKEESRQYLTGLLLIWCFIGICIAVFYMAFGYASRGKPLWGFTLILLGIVAPRMAMLLQGWPADAFPFGFFNPMQYAYSTWMPSLGDLLINISLLFFVIFYLFRYYPLSNLFFRVYRLPAHLTSLLLLLLTVASFALTGFLYDLLKSLFFDTSRLLEPTDLFDIDLFPWYIVICIVLLAIAYFFAFHLVSFQVLAWAGNLTKIYVWATLSIGLATGYAYWVWHADYPHILYGLHAAYFAFLLFTALPRRIKQFKYRSYLYFFTAAGVVATVCTYTIWNFRKWENGIYRQKISNLLIEEKDIIGEYLLEDARKNIESDSLLNHVMSTQSPFVATLEDFIKQKLMDKHFKQYEIEVYAFDKEGRQLISYKTFPDLYTYRRSIRNSMQTVRKDTLYFESNFSANVFKHYVLFITVKNEQTPAGYIALDLKWRGHNPGRVYDQLLAEQQVSLQYFPKLSFAFYQDTLLTSTYGPFNFSKYNDVIARELRQRINNEFNIENQTITPLYLREGRILVIATPYFPILAVLANFSFIFLLLAGMIFLLIAFYLASKLFSRGTLSYAFKIQLYLNIAFFTPLLAVSVITISVLAQVNKNSNIETALLAAAKIKEKVLPLYQKVANQSLTYSYFKTELDILAKSLDADFNIYNNDGKLFYSSRQMIFDRGLVSKYLNPEIIEKLVLAGQEREIVAEHIGSLWFNTVYLELKQNRAERLLGTLALPFSNSGKLINRNLNILITNILNIFTATFLIFLILSYFASQIIIHPLKLITAQLRKTTLENNEPLHWDAADEIGLMVQEYNKMLHNIEESKKQLAQSEKELAWREMARQVAHEIKNPLTPMKLSLQLMRRRLLAEQEGDKQKMITALDTLLTQIENLSEIATSFSMFAQMPQLENVPFNLVQLLQAGCALFASNERVQIETHLPTEPIIVLADENAMSRLLSNLLLNAIQSVPPERQPNIKVGAAIAGNYGRFWVQDNGIGIPDDVGEKVFLPNFSTKVGGSGIGLALAKRAVLHASGRIWFETKLDEGTTFYVELPLA